MNVELYMMQTRGKSKWTPCPPHGFFQTNILCITVQSAGVALVVTAGRKYFHRISLHWPHEARVSSRKCSVSSATVVITKVHPQVLVEVSTSVLLYTHEVSLT